MTDLNLKAGNLKKALATFMAVCLTVLSVNVPAFAATVEKTVDGYQPGIVAVEVTSALDAAKVTNLDGIKPVAVIDKITVGETVLATTTLEGVEAVGFTEEIKDGKSTVSVEVAYPENREDAVRVIEGKVVFNLTEDVVVAEAFKVTQGYLVKEDYSNSDDVVDENGNPVSAFNGDPDKAVTTDPNGYVAVDPDKALDKDQYAGDLNNITTDLDGKTPLKKDVVKVKVFDGLATKKSNVGSEVATYSVKAGATVNATVKVKALATNYVEGKVFDKFVVATEKTEGKKTTYEVTTTEFTFPATVSANTVVVATYKDADIDDMLYGAVTIQKGKKATVQATFPTLAKGDKVECVVASALDATKVNDADAKKVLKSVKANAKSGTLTFSAGKVTGEAVAVIKVTNKKAGTSKEIGKYDVTVQDGAVVYNEIWLATNTGVDTVILDKTSASKTAQLVAHPSTTNVKYVVTAGTLETGTKSGLDSKAAKAAVAVAKADKTKAISVSKTGVVTAKKTGVANVYAVQTTKMADKTYTVTISNPVNVTVNATATGFTLTGGKTFKYSLKKVSAYNAKKDTKVKFAVKAKGETTDKIVVRAVNMDGKVVLNALNRDTKKVTVKKADGTKEKVNQFIPNAYYNTVVKGYNYTAKDNLIVVATAPAGQQQYKMVKFEGK